jgi:hypothetical protein
VEEAIRGEKNQDAATNIYGYGIRKPQKNDVE